MKRFISNIMKAAHRYTVWDFGALKLCMFTIGIIVGAYFSAFFMNWIFVVCSIFILSWLWIVYKTFMK